MPLGDIMSDTDNTTTTTNETQELLSQLQSALQRPTLHNPPPYQTYAKTLLGRAATGCEPNSLMDQPPSIVTPTPAQIPVEDLDILPTPTVTTEQDDQQPQSDTYEISTDTTPIGFELWEALAYDLALAHADPTTIADEYRLTTAQLAHLQENEYFAKMLKAKREEVAQLGSQAAEVAFTVKMRMLANRATPEFLKRLTHPATATKDFHNLFKLAVELAQLGPTEQDETTATPAIGASVVFNINGVPGLSHLQAQETPPTIDAEYVEVTPATSTTHTDDLEYELGEL